MAEGIRWICPACFTPLESVGPSTMTLEIACHIHDHERAARRAALATCGMECSKLMTTDSFCAARKPNLQGLTLFDEGWLKSLRISWNLPITAEDLK